MARDDAAVLDIVLACRLVLDFKQDMTKQAFLGDAKTQSAVLHQLLIIGEATRRRSQRFCASHGDIPWQQIRGMRNRLMHEYNDVDLDEVWKTDFFPTSCLRASVPSCLPKDCSLTPPSSLIASSLLKHKCQMSSGVFRCANGKREADKMSTWKKVTALRTDLVGINRCGRGVASVSCARRVRRGDR